MSDFNWPFPIEQQQLFMWGGLLLYVATAYVCWRVAQGLRKFGTPRRTEARVWLTIACVFVALAVFRELDVQSVITEYWRSTARQQGWYSSRRNFQPIVILAIGTSFVLAAGVLMSNLEDMSPFARAALLGTLMLMAYVAVRVVSLHDVDVLAGQRVLGLRFAWIVELAAILSVLLSALWRRARIKARVARIAGDNAWRSGRFDRLGDSFTGRRPPATTRRSRHAPEGAPDGHADRPQDPAPHRPRQPADRRTVRSGLPPGGEPYT